MPFNNPINSLDSRGLFPGYFIQIYLRGHCIKMRIIIIIYDSSHTGRNPEKGATTGCKTAVQQAKRLVGLPLAGGKRVFS
jgi:hypothetical protein